METADPKQLKPHPENRTFFDPLPDEAREALREDIRKRGVLDPILITKDGTILAGHERWKAALELGLDSVPVRVVEADGEEALSILVSENLLRREAGRRAKLKAAKALVERWGIRRGGPRAKGQRGPLKTLGDVARTVGMSERSLKRLLRIGDLPGPLLDLLDEGRISQREAEELARLPPDVLAGVAARIERGERAEEWLEEGREAIARLQAERAAKPRGEGDEERARIEELRRSVADAERALVLAGRDPRILLGELRRLGREVRALAPELRALHAPEARREARLWSGAFREMAEILEDLGDGKNEHGAGLEARSSGRV